MTNENENSKTSHILSGSHPIWNRGDTDAPLVKPSQDIAYSVAQLQNQGGVSEGSQIPPDQHGTWRVQRAAGFKVQSSQYNPATLNTLFVLQWQDVTDSANGLNQTTNAGYRIYAQLSSAQNSEPTLVAQSAQSPAFALVSSPQAASNVTFWLQPYLTSGQTIPLTACPTCTGTTVVPYYAFSTTDPHTGLTALVQINSGLPYAGGTTVGLGVTYPAGTPPFNTYYCTITGLGLEAFAGITIDVNGTGIGGYKTPGDNKLLYVITASEPSPGVFKGYLAACDGSGSGGITGAGDVAAIDANTIEVILKGAHLVEYSAVTAATATAGAGTLPASPEMFLVIGVDSTNYKIPLYKA